MTRFVLSKVQWFRGKFAIGHFYDFLYGYLCHWLAWNERRIRGGLAYVDYLRDTPTKL